MKKFAQGMKKMSVTTIETVKHYAQLMARIDDVEKKFKDIG